MMTITKPGRKNLTMFTLFVALGLLSVAVDARAQTSGSPVIQEANVGSGEKKSVHHQSGESKGATSPGVADDQVYRNIIKSFTDNYRIGPADAFALRVKGQPDYSIEKLKVSPTGTVYHPLLGDIQVAGYTLEQLKKQLTTDLSEYLLNPVVSIELLEAQSAKVGIIGEVRNPKILMMSGPMSILDAITEAGGFTDTGRKSGVTLLRQNPNGERTTIKVNLKNILNGKAEPGENIALQAGDTVIVHGNAMKAIPIIAGITSFGSLLSFISLGAR